MGVGHEPGFKWWVPYTLKKFDAIISLGKKHSGKYLNCAHKLWIDYPKTMEN